MDDFKMDQENMNGAIVSMLAEMLAHHWTLAEYLLADMAKREGKDIPTLLKEYEKSHAGYQKRVWENLRGNYGRFDFNDLIK